MCCSACSTHRLLISRSLSSVWKCPALSPLFIPLVPTQPSICDPLQVERPFTSSLRIQTEYLFPQPHQEKKLSLIEQGCTLQLALVFLLIRAEDHTITSVPACFSFSLTLTMLFLHEKTLRYPPSFP